MHWVRTLHRELTARNQQIAAMNGSLIGFYIFHPLITLPNRFAALRTALSARCA
jgi:hypothetical protein